MERFEENFGRYAYVNLPQIKDYLGINSNTKDASLSNVIFYATAAIEHYIGQEVIANNYTEVFDGGQSSVFVNRLPLNNVHEVAEYDGNSYELLQGPNSDGTMVDTENKDSKAVQNIGAVTLRNRIKKFGPTSAQFNGSNYLAVPDDDDFYFDTENFTIDLQARLAKLNTTQMLVTHFQNATNKWEFRFNANQGLQFRVVESGTETINVAHAATTGYVANTFQHFAVVRNGTSLKLYRNGVHIGSEGTIAKTVDVPNLTGNVEIGRSGSNTELFTGFIDELRISRSAQYTAAFDAPEFQHSTDDDTVLLLHFDGSEAGTGMPDDCATENGFSFTRDTGEITRDVGNLQSQGTYPTVRRDYPSLDLQQPPKFQPYPNAVKVKYNAGYKSTEVPYDLQLATLDYIKLLYKQDQDKRGFSFEGERQQKYALSSNIPPHIRRILDLYRIIR